MKILRGFATIFTIAALLSMQSLSYSLEISIEDTDPLSMDVLIKSGLVDISNDVDKKVDTSTKVMPADNKDLNDEPNSYAYQYVDNLQARTEFYIITAEVISRSDIVLKFTQRVDDKLSSIDFITLKDGEGNVIPRSKYRLVRSDNNPQMIVLKAKEDIFNSYSKMNLYVKMNILSSYGVSYDMSQKDIDVIVQEIKNNQILKIVPYSDGIIDIYFEGEVSDELLNNYKKFKLSYGENYLYTVLPTKGRLIEDPDGISRVLRIKFPGLYEKYDYRLESYSSDQFYFPGPSEKLDSSLTDDVTIIDGENIIVQMKDDIDESKEKLRVSVLGKANISNTKIVGDKIYIALDKSGALDREEEYYISLKNFYNNDYEVFESVKIPFDTFGDELFSYYLEPKIENHTWLDNGLLKITFNKPVLLDDKLGTSLKISDKDGTNIKCKKLFSVNPMIYILNLEGSNKEEKYNLSIKGLRELGKTVHKDIFEYEISNDVSIVK